MLGECSPAVSSGTEGEEFQLTGFLTKALP